jgi:3-oxoacyl-[acyl-carrier-protein] synthase-3
MEYGIGILGVGYTVPEEVRTNDAPVFDWLRDHQPAGKDLFAGYLERRVLAPGETVTDLLLSAAQRAMDHAGCSPEEIGLLLGYVSVSKYGNPNGLGEVHKSLGLPEGALIVPVNNEFNNFNSAILIAQGLLPRTGGKRALIACAGNWTRHVDYQTPQSLSAADGAGAAVVGPTSDPAHFTVLDHETVVWSDNFGAMFMAGDAVTTNPDCDWSPRDCTFTTPYFHISKAGENEYRNFGVQAPPLAVKRLLKRNKLTGADIALVTHQSSSVLLDAWKEAIQPAQYLETLEQFANMTVANLPVNLAYWYDRISTEYLVINGIGVEGQTNAVLLKRG